MNEFGSARSPRPWNFYPNSDPTEYSSPPRMETYKSETGPWKDFGATSMNAISFGFVATAILISMFLIMAILEHLFRTDLSLSSSNQDGVGRSLELGSSAKSRNQDMVKTTYATGLSVVMPGQKYPTCIAQPAPLIPFPREGVRWPPHEHRFTNS